MAHVTTTEQGSITSVSTQLSQEFFAQNPDGTPLPAGGAYETDWVLIRGAPRVLIHAQQTAGAVAATVFVEIAISDDDNGLIKALVLQTFLTPALTPVSIALNHVPAKLLRLRVQAPGLPGGNSVRAELAIMAAQ